MCLEENGIESFQKIFLTSLKEHVPTLNKHSSYKNYISSLHQAIVERFANKKVEF